MLTRIYQINEYIAIMPRPNGSDYLENEVKNWQKEAFSIVVSLLTKEEIRAFQLEKESDYCEKYGIEFINFPINDMQIPESYLKT